MYIVPYNNYRRLLSTETSSSGGSLINDQCTNGTELKNP